LDLEARRRAVSASTLQRFNVLILARSFQFAGRPKIVYSTLLEFLEHMKKSRTPMENAEKIPSDAAENLEPLTTIDAASVTPEQFEELKARAAKADESWERLLRTTADFDNFKKRAARERTEAIQFANAALIQKLLPVLDSFEMALSAAQNTKDPQSSSLQAGIVMVQSQLKNALAEAGAEEIDAAGKPFDPMLHEAVSKQETADVPEGQVIQQMRKGYKLRERLLRPALVVVAEKPASAK
jgi:molecular chaperone GrpE